MKLGTSNLFLYGLFLGSLCLPGIIVGCTSEHRHTSKGAAAPTTKYQKGDLVRIRVDGRKGVVTKVVMSRYDVCYAQQTKGGYETYRFKDFELEPWTEPAGQQKEGVR